MLKLFTFKYMNIMLLVGYAHYTNQMLFSKITSLLFFARSSFWQTVIAVVRLCIMAMEVDETLISDMVFLGQQVFFKHYNKWISNKGGWVSHRARIILSSTDKIITLATCRYYQLSSFSRVFRELSTVL